MSKGVNKIKEPAYYNWHPKCECIEIIRHFNFNRGSAIKYIWRAGKKGNEVEDLRKAIGCLLDEINYLEGRVK